MIEVHARQRRVCNQTIGLVVRAPNDILRDFRGANWIRGNFGVK